RADGGIGRGRARSYGRVFRRRRAGAPWPPLPPPAAPPPPPPPPPSRAPAAFRRTPRTVFARQGWRGLGRLGLRNAADRPGRSVLVVAVIASATFMVISVDAFRRGAPAATDRQSGVGGYALLVNLALPIA